MNENENEMDILTEEEVAALGYAQQRGCRLPSWIEPRGAQYSRPHRLTPEEFAEYARILDLYNNHAAATALAALKPWVIFLGVLALIGVAAAIFSSCSALI